MAEGHLKTHSVNRRQAQRQLMGAARAATFAEIKKTAINSLSSLKQELLSRSAAQESVFRLDALLEGTSSLLASLWQENKLSAGTKKAITNLLAQLDATAKDAVALQLNGKMKSLIAGALEALVELQPREKQITGTQIAGSAYPLAAPNPLQAVLIPAGLNIAAFNLNLTIPGLSLFTPLTQAGSRPVEEQTIYHRFVTDLIQIEDPSPASEVLSVALAERLHETFFRAAAGGQKTEKQLQAAFEKALQTVQAEIKQKQLRFEGKLTNTEIALTATTLLSHLPAQEALAILTALSVRLARENPKQEGEIQNLTAQIVSQFTGRPEVGPPTITNYNLPANINNPTNKPVISAPEVRVVGAIISAFVAALIAPKEEAAGTIGAAAEQKAGLESRTLTIDQTTYTGPLVSAPSQAPERASTVFTAPTRIIELIRVVAEKLPALALPALIAETAKLASTPAIQREVEAVVLAAAGTKEGQKYVLESVRRGEPSSLLNPSEIGGKVIVETVKALLDPKARLQEAREARPAISGKATPTVTEQVAQLAALVINTNKVAPTALTAAQALPLLEFVAQAQQARQTIKETQAQIAKNVKEGKLPTPAKSALRTSTNPKQIEAIADSIGTLAKTAQKMEGAGLKVPDVIMQSLAAGLAGLSLIPPQRPAIAKAPESKPAPRGQLDSFVKVLEAEIERLQTVAATDSTKAPTKFIAWQVQAQIEAIIISIQAAAANEDKIKKIRKELEDRALFEAVLKAIQKGDASSLEAVRDAIYEMRLIINKKELEKFSRPA
ncbi:MAG: hypothetical protein WCW67_03965 [Candidatus Margulisiibacteriota bacterium]|jgi:hypothetical protein